MMDQNIEHEISSMTYDLLTSGVSNDRIMDLVLNEFGDDAYEVVQFILSEESESWYAIEDSNLLQATSAKRYFGQWRSLGAVQRIQHYEQRRL